MIDICKRLRMPLVVMVLMLSACVSREPLALDPGVKRLDTNVLPAPTSRDAVALSRPYYVGPYDKLRVEVFGVQELQRDIQTDADGAFSFPLVGRIVAAGSTPTQVAAMLRDRLAGRYVKNPQVTVNLVDASGQAVTVDGQVQRPGGYSIGTGMTLLRAVAAAGGASEFAKLDDVVVFRTVEGQRYVALYNLAAIRRGNYADPAIYANDVVVVGDSPGRRLFKDLLAVTPLLSTPLIILAQRG